MDAVSPFERVVRIVASVISFADCLTWSAVPLHNFGGLISTPELETNYLPAKLPVTVRESAGPEARNWHTDGRRSHTSSQLLSASKATNTKNACEG